MNHELKTWPEYYQAIIDGIKTFEVRKDDRGFEVGDMLRLREYHPCIEPDPCTGRYTGRYCYVKVIYMLRNFPGLEEGYCVMGIRQRV